MVEQACLDSLRQLPSSLASESCVNTQDCLILRSNSGRLDLYCVPGSKTNPERPSKHGTDGSHQLQVGLRAPLFGALKTNCKLNTAADLKLFLKKASGSIEFTCPKTLDLGFGDFGFWRSAVRWRWVKGSKVQGSICPVPRFRECRTVTNTAVLVSLSAEGTSVEASLRSWTDTALRLLLTIRFVVDPKKYPLRGFSRGFDLYSEVQCRRAQWTKAFGVTGSNPTRRWPQAPNVRNLQGFDR